MQREPRCSDTKRAYAYLHSGGLMSGDCIYVRDVPAGWGPCVLHSAAGRDGIALILAVMDLGLPSGLKSGRAHQFLLIFAAYSAPHWPPFTVVFHRCSGVVQDTHSTGCRVAQDKHTALAAVWRRAYTQLLLYGAGTANKAAASVWDRTAVPATTPGWSTGWAADISGEPMSAAQIAAATPSPASVQHHLVPFPHLLFMEPTN